jgi:hypothetical protein
MVPKGAFGLADIGHPHYAYGTGLYSAVPLHLLKSIAL